MGHIALITNGEIGTSVRGKLNTAIARENKNTGWGNYEDSAHTSGSPLVVAEGVTVLLTNNKAVTTETQLPQGTTTLYNGTRMTPDALGDVYDMRLSFKAESSAHAGSFSITFDSSSAGDGSDIVFTKSASTVLNVNTVQDYSFPANFFIASALKNNGGILRIKSISGILKVSDFSIFINKVHAGH